MPFTRTLKSRMLTAFPVSVTGTAGIEAAIVNGRLQIEPAFEQVASEPSVPEGQTREVLVRDPASDIYTRVPLSAFLGDFAYYSDEPQSTWVTAALGRILFVPGGKTVTVRVPEDAATIDAALSGVREWIVPAGALVIINIANGKYIRTTPIIFDLTFGERVQIRSRSSVTGIGFVSAGPVTTNGAGDHDIPITLSNASSLNVGEYIRFTSTTGTGNHHALRGYHEIIGKVGNVITVKFRDRRGVIPAMTVASMTVAKMPVMFKWDTFDAFTGEFFGLDILTSLGNLGTSSAPNIGLDGIGLVGNRSTAATNGLRVSNDKSLFVDGGLCVAGWGRNNIWLFRGCQAYLDEAVSSDAAVNAFYALQNTTCELIRSVGSGSDTGFAIIGASQAAMAQISAVGNSTGVECLSGSVGTISSAALWGNILRGMNVDTGGLAVTSSCSFGETVVGINCSTSGRAQSPVSNTFDATCSTPFLPLRMDSTGAVVFGSAATGSINVVGSVTQALDFPSQAAGTFADLTVAVAGAAMGTDHVLPIAWTAAPSAQAVTITGFVSAADTVTVRCVYNAAVDPANRTARITVVRYA